jgi:hypothetical protein
MRLRLLALVLLLTLTACGGRPFSATESLTPAGVAVVATLTPTALPATAVVATSTSPATASAAETAVLSLTDTPPPAPSPTPAPSLDEARAATAQELAETQPPAADPFRLAVAYRGVSSVLATPPPPDAPQLGDVATFTIGNVDDNTVSQISARLLSVGDNAYYWFDQSADVGQPNADELAEITAAFDDIYETLYAFFGTTEPPGGRAHIVHASPAALCVNPDSCSLAGYFNAGDLLPRVVEPQSNERTMFVMNADQYGTERYLDVLAHELRHMLGAGYDMSDEDWFIEGAATLAQDLVGFADSPQGRGSFFLQNPDQQLNSWSDENPIPHYGQGYLVNRFFYDRLGPELYRAFTTSPAAGLAALDTVAAAEGLDVTGEGLWLDWLVSMAVHDNPDAPERYRWNGPELGPVATTAIDNVPATFETTVQQYAADYYELPDSASFQIDFAGAPAVSLLGVDAPSGDMIWVAQRANDSNPRLTRAVDLRGVDAATLTYRVFADIELGYDFAYVSASTDGGQVWQPLVGEQMQGLDPADDPSGSALAERFYSGRTRAWRDETIDLTPFAGQEILLRFEYVTDLILSYAGLALDDIAIDAIGFADDAETLDDGWLAEGFVRATTALPQQWHLQLVTFDQDEQPAVELIPVGADGRVQFTFEAVAGGRRPMLIVAATAPDTLEAASYSLVVNNR